MTIEQFWEIIDVSRQEGGGWEEMFDPLVNRLAALKLEDLFLWGHIFDEYQRLSYKEKLWAAAYVINGGCSDDGFDYFRGWLTAQGREVFHQALRDPDSLAEMDCVEEDVGYEDILSAAPSAYFKKQGIFDRPYERYYKESECHPLSGEFKAQMRSGIIYASDIDVEWDEDNGLSRLLPKLCKAFDW